MLADVTQGDGEAIGALARLRREVKVLPGQRESNGEPTWLLFDPVRDRYFSIGWLEHELLKYWDSASLPATVEQVLAHTTLDVDEEEVLGFNRFITDNELVECQTLSDLEQMQQRSHTRARALEKSLLQRQIFKRFSLLHPDKFLELTLPFVRPLMSVWWRRLVIAMAVICAFLVMRQWSQFSQAVVELFAWQSAPMVLATLVVIKIIHELGHAYTCKYYGLSVPTMGVALFVVWPFLFTNTNAAWRLTKRGSRLAVGLAGVLAEVYVAVLCLLLWFVVADGVFRSALLFLGTVSLATTIAINANPFMRWDGYYVLSDWLRVENMQPRAFNLAKWWLRRVLLGLGDPCPDPFESGMARGLIGYAFLTWLYRVILFAGLAMLAYTGLYKTFGLVAAIVVMYWFVAKPIIMEVKYLVTRRHDLSINRHTIAFFGVVVAGLILLIAPLDNSITRKAQVMAAKQQSVYSPVDGRVKRLSVQLAQHVDSGDILFEVESAKSDYEIGRVRNKIQYYQSIARRQSDRQVLQERALIKTQLEYLDEQKQGLLAQRERMQVRSSLSGQVTKISRQLREGVYVSTRQPLVHLLSAQEFKVIAYVDHTDLQRLSVGARATFIAENLNQPALTLHLAEIDTSPSVALETLMLAHAHGGDVPVLGDGADALPAGAYYRLTFSIEANEGAATSNLHRGTVHIDADQRNFVSQIADAVSGLVLRESGF